MARRLAGGSSTCGRVPQPHRRLASSPRSSALPWARGLEPLIGPGLSSPGCPEPDAAGRGCAAEATRLVVDYALRDLGLRRVHLEVRADNERAIALYERTGFVRAGGGEGWVLMERFSAKA